MLPPTSLRPGSFAIFLSGLGKRPSVPTRRPLILLETPRIHNSYWLVASLRRVSHNILNNKILVFDRDRRPVIERLHPPAGP